LLASGSDPRITFEGAAKIYLERVKSYPVGRTLDSVALQEAHVCQGAAFGMREFLLLELRSVESAAGQSTLALVRFGRIK
jgi:hypothetical protein